MGNPRDTSTSSTSDTQDPKLAEKGKQTLDPAPMEEQDVDPNPGDGSTSTGPGQPQGG
jgi:hypothetical protein